MSRRPVIIALVAAAALCGLAIGAGYVVAGAPLYLALAALATLAWLATWRRGLSLGVDAGLTLAIAAAAAGIVVGAPAAAMAAGVISALVAWDLMHVDLRLGQVKRVERAREIEGRELRWAAIAAAAGLALTLLALAIKAQVSFTLVFALGVIAALALGRAIRLLRT